MIAVRENERAAAAFTVSPIRAKLTAFAISGAMCGLAGGLLAGLFVQFDSNSFPVDASIQVVAIAVIGGLGSVAGPLLGALYVIGVPAIFGSDPNVGLATSGIGLLVLLMYFPGGLVGIAYRVRDTVFALGRQRGGTAVDEPATSRDEARPVRAQSPRHADTTVRRCESTRCRCASRAWSRSTA